jgi:hypothetical protein
MGCFLPPNRNKTPHIKQKTCIEPKHYIFLVQSGGSWKNKEGKKEEKRREEEQRRKILACHRKRELGEGWTQ